MRITAFMLYSQFADSLSKNYSKLGKAQTQLSTGKRLTKPSDDVIALRGAMAYKVSINAIGQYYRNIDEGISTLGVTESALSATTNILNRARELAVSESSDTATPSTRENTSYELQNLFNELVNIGNSKLKNKYIFSGYSSSTQAFSSAGSYQGDTNDFEIFVNNGIKSKINVTGDVAFSDRTKFITNDLTGETLQGTLRITTGSNNPVDLPIKDTATSATPEEIRDAINSPMSGWYTDGTTTVGDGTLTIKVGTRSPVTVQVNSANGNDTVATLASYINSNVPGLEARIATDATTSEVRLFFRPTTTGESFSIDVSNDSDNNNVDTNGLSALLHNDLQSNLTTNALGIEAFVINDSSSKRLLIEPSVPNTSFSISVTDTDDSNNTDLAGLSLLYHASSSTTNMNSSISFFSILDHMRISLANNDAAGIRASILLLDGALDSAVNTTADVGSRLKYLEDQKTRLEDNELSYKTSLAVLEDADIAAVATDLTKIQSTLEAMRISSLKGLSQSLFDFLG